MTPVVLLGTLIERWRKLSNHGPRSSGQKPILEQCADELEAALATLPSVYPAVGVCIDHTALPTAPPQEQEHGNEHAGGSLNGPSRLGASPNTDTGGECVLVPRSLVVSTVNLCDVTKLGLHGTPWAQSELKALQTKLESRLAASPPAQEQEPK